ncbi:MAG: hypothetical protein JWL88_566 [Parcubacteria group bacterium]|nr:hypothetical protein [Parcubacteria group bacterium]
MLFSCEGVPVVPKYTRCRFGCAIAIAKFSIPEGCESFPNDTEQCLCVEHVLKTKPLGDMQLVCIFQPLTAYLIRPHAQAAE